jgi:hypothetical protein
MFDSIIYDNMTKATLPESEEARAKELLFPPQPLARFHCTASCSRKRRQQQPQQQQQQFSRSLREPAGSLREPLGSLREPAESLQEPAGSLQEPAGSLREPAVSLQEPAGSLQEPSVSLREPAGSLQEQAGSLREPWVVSNAYSLLNAWWMAERLVPLLATQAAWVRFPVPARPTFRVGKVALLSNPVSWGTFSSTAIEIRLG